MSQRPEDMQSANNQEVAQFAARKVPANPGLAARLVSYLTERVQGVRRLHVTVFGGTVAVRGEMRSRQDKRLCLECCSRVPGVCRIVDELIVVADAPPARRAGPELA